MEDARQQRYRPNPNPVRPGDGFVSQLNHFAYYYNQYRLLAYGPQNLRLPIVTQGNCWLEGSAMAVSSCIPCLGCIVFLPLACQRQVIPGLMLSLLLCQIS